MIKLTPEIWTGTSDDAEHADLKAAGVGAILNVAHDMQCFRGWTDGIEYAQCGLVDGPGTSIASYHAAVLKLAGLVRGGRKTLVVDHTNGGRVLFTVISYLNLTDRRGWDGWMKLLSERLDIPDGVPHPAHKVAFNKLNWRLLASILED